MNEPTMKIFMNRILINGIIPTLTNVRIPKNANDNEKIIIYLKYIIKHKYNEYQHLMPISLFTLIMLKITDNNMNNDELCDFMNTELINILFLLQFNYNYNNDN